MKKLTTLLVLVCALISSCTIEKRHYLDGYHVEWNHRVKANPIATGQTAEEPQPYSEAAAITETPAMKSLPVETSVQEETAMSADQPRVAGEKKISKSKTAYSKSEAKKTSKFNASRKLLRSDFSSYAQMSLEDRSYFRIDDILLLILALFVSPLAVYLHEGSWNTACWINLILWICLIVPGIIHAFIVILL